MKGQRSRKGTKSSSSSAASNMLMQQGFNPSIVSLGFGAFATTSNATNNTTTTKITKTVALPKELSALLKHAIKPSKPTRLRALHNLKALLDLNPSTNNSVADESKLSSKSSASPSNTFTQPQFRSLAQEYVTVFKTLQNDDDRRIREAAVSVLGALSTRIKLYKPILSNTLKDLSSPWWCSIHDPAREVSKAATQAFHTAFSTPKQRTHATTFCAAQICRVAVTNLTSSIKSSGGKDLTETTRLRIKSTAIHSLSALLAFPVSASNEIVHTESTKSTKSRKLIDSSESSESTDSLELVPFLLPTATPALIQLLSNTLWRTHFKNGTKHTSIRSACYKLMLVLCNTSSDFIFHTKYVQGILKPFFKICFNDTHSPNHRLVWDTVLTLLSSFSNYEQNKEGKNENCKNEIWSLYIVQPLLLNLKKGTYGAGRVAYRSLLPLFSFAPRSLYITVLDALLEGMSSLMESTNGTVHFIALLEAHCEILQYISNKEKKNDAVVNESLNESVNDVSMNVMKQVQKVLDWCMSDLTVTPIVLSHVGKLHFSYGLAMQQENIWISIVEKILKKEEKKEEEKEEKKHEKDRSKEMDDTVLPEWSCVRLGHLFQEASSSVAFTQTAERLLLQCIDLLDTKDTKNDDEEDNLQKEQHLVLAITLSNAIPIQLYSSCSLQKGTEAYQKCVTVLAQHLDRPMEMVQSVVRLCVASMFRSGEMQNENQKKECFSLLLKNVANNYASNDFIQRQQLAVVAFIVKEVTQIVPNDQHLWCPFLSDLLQPLHQEENKHNIEHYRGLLDLFKSCVDGQIIPKEYINKIIMQCTTVLEDLAVGEFTSKKCTLTNTKRKEEVATECIDIIISCKNYSSLLSITRAAVVRSTFNYNDTSTFKKNWSILRQNSTTNATNTNATNTSTNTSTNASTNASTNISTNTSTNTSTTTTSATAALTTMSTSTNTILFHVTNLFQKCHDQIEDVIHTTTATSNESNESNESILIQQNQVSKMSEKYVTLLMSFVTNFSHSKTGARNLLIEKEEEEFDTVWFTSMMKASKLLNLSTVPSIASFRFLSIIDIFEEVGLDQQINKNLSNNENESNNATNDVNDANDANDANSKRSLLATTLLPLWEGYSNYLSSDDWCSVPGGFNTMHFLHDTLIPELCHNTESALEAALNNTFNQTMSNNALHFMLSSKFQNSTTTKEEQKKEEEEEKQKENNKNNKNNETKSTGISSTTINLNQVIQEKKETKDSLETEKKEMVGKYKRGESVVYRKDPKQRKGEAAVVMKVHYDDAVPYYTLRLFSGTEKQTVEERIQPLMSSRFDDDDDDEKDEKNKKSNSGASVLLKKKRKKKRMKKKKTNKRFENTMNANQNMEITAMRLWKTMLERIVMLLSNDSMSHTTSMLLINILSSVVDCVPWSSIKDTTNNTSNNTTSSIVSTSSATSSTNIILLKQVKSTIIQRLIESKDDDSQNNLLLLLCVHLHSISNVPLQEEDMLTIDDVVQKFVLQFTHSQVGLGLIEMTSYALHHDPTLLMLHYQNIDAVLEIATLNIYDSVEKENGDRITHLRIACCRLMQVCAQACNEAGHILRRSTSIIQCLNRLCHLPLRSLHVRTLIDALSALLPWIEISKENDIQALFNLFTNTTITNNNTLLHLRLKDTISNWLIIYHNSNNSNNSSNSSSSMFPTSIQPYLHQHLTMPTTTEDLQTDSPTDVQQKETKTKQSTTTTTAPFSSLSLSVAFFLIICDLAQCPSTLPSRLQYLSNIAQNCVGTLLTESFTALRVLGEEKLNRNSKDQSIEKYNIDTVVMSSFQNVELTLTNKLTTTKSNVTNVTNQKMKVPSSIVLHASCILQISIAFPTCLRQWYHTLTRADAAAVSHYYEKYITPYVIMQEKEKLKKDEKKMDTKSTTDQQIDPRVKKSVEENKGQPMTTPNNPFGNDDDDDDGDDTLSVQYDSSTLEFISTYKKGECTLEIGIVLPSNWPLKTVKVECRKRIGIKENQWRKWSLQIQSLLTNCDGSIMDGIQLWKKNVDREFEGVEECSICYSVVHVTDGSLPKICCHVCNNSFHSGCLYKWFSNASKSTCPLCRSDF